MQSSDRLVLIFFSKDGAKGLEITKMDFLFMPEDNKKTAMRGEKRRKKVQAEKNEPFLRKVKGCPKTIGQPFCCC